MSIFSSFAPVEGHLFAVLRTRLFQAETILVKPKIFGRAFLHSEEDAIAVAEGTKHQYEQQDQLQFVTRSESDVIYCASYCQKLPVRFNSYVLVRQYIGSRRDRTHIVIEVVDFTFTKNWRRSSPEWFSVAMELAVV
jgi:hypothetical protein